MNALFEPKPYVWAAKPASLEAKFKLMCRLPYDSRVKRRHVLVFGFILDWFHSHYGNALASVRHIDAHLKARDPSGTGLYIGQIHGALADLVSWGYLNREDGKGRRANRYTPAWAVLEPCVQESPNANDNDRSVLFLPNTSVLDSPNANGHSVHEFPNEDPPTPTRVIDPGTVCREVSAPAPAADAPGGSGFDRVWQAYGRLGNKAAARKAFDVIADPDVDLIAERAKSWAASAKPGQRRMPLERWLAAEKWDEADRRVAAKPGKAAPAGVTTIKSITESGSPFTNLYVDVVMIDDAGKETARRLHVGALGDDGPDAATYRGLLRAAPNARLAGWTVDANTLAPIAPPAETVTAEPAPRPAEPEPEPGPRQKRPKPKIQQREIPSDREGRKEMLARWRRNGFFDEGDVA